MVTGAPPLIGIFLTCPPWENAIHCPSGDTIGAPTSFVPGSDTAAVLTPLLHPKLGAPYITRTHIHQA